MLHNTSKKLPHGHSSVDSLAKSTATISPATRTAEESDSRDIIDNDPVVDSGVAISLSNKHDASLATDLNDNANSAIDTSSSASSSNSRAVGAAYALTAQDELVQKICDAADMACKAKRVNQLLSYVSGVDYSMTQDSGYEPAGGALKEVPKQARKATST